MNQFENIGNKLGLAKAKNIRTSKNHFNNFLRSLHEEDPNIYPYSNLDDAPEDYFQNFRDVLGRFPSFIKDVTNVKRCDSNLLYVGKVMGLIENKNPDSDVFKNDWYTNLRDSIKKAYMEDCALNGEKFYNSTSPLLSEDLIHLCTVLFIENSRESLSNRDFLGKL
eukprot:gene20753-26908_t